MSDNTPRRRLWKTILVVCLILFFLALLLLLRQCFPTNEPIVPPVDNTTTESGDTTTTTEAVVLPDNPIDFAAKQKENPHIIAWIRIPGTVIDYPIMQSGNDVPENFYLDHNPERKADRNGSIYIQQINRADFGHPNTVIYGHNMRNGSMFAALHKFRDGDFFDKNEYIYVYTPGHILKYRIFSAFVYDDRHILNAFDFSDPDEYADFLEQSLNPISMTKQVRKGVEVTTDDRIITLSTCTSYDRERYLVEGVLIDDQPTK